MKPIVETSQSLYSFYQTLSVSDQIEVLGIITSFTVSIIAIVISLLTLRQNSKMIEESSRPIISIYGESINVGTSAFYIVIKNFGASPAYITQFEYDCDFSSLYLSYKGIDYLKTLQNSVLAPGQSRICALNYSALNAPITFTISYSSGSQVYHDKISIDLKAGASMLITKNSTKDKELRNISYALQEIIQKNL